MKSNPNYLQRLYNASALSQLEWFFREEGVVSDKGLIVLSSPNMMKKVMKAVKKHKGHGSVVVNL